MRQEHNEASHNNGAPKQAHATLEGAAAPSRVGKPRSGRPTASPAHHPGGANTPYRSQPKAQRRRDNK
jgi:hypothetical protein